MQAPDPLPPRKTPIFSPPRLFGSVILAALLASMAWAFGDLWYSETQGPFKNLTQVVDLDADGDLDILVSHTRWEAVDISWAGVGRWINQGQGKFALVERGSDPFAGFAGGAGDVDQDGDADIFIQDYEVSLLENQGGAQGGQAGKFLPDRGGMNATSPYGGYKDMGGSIVMGDLNADGRVDAFVAGCCYGMNPARPGDDYPHAPSVSLVWINDGSIGPLHAGHTLRMPALDGLPVRGAALGDVDADGDLDVVAAVGRPAMGTADSLGALILLNDGTGVLALSAQRLGEADSRAVALGDVNGDGRLDVLVGSGTGARLWLNQGGGSAGEPIFAPVEQTFAARQTLGARLQAGFSSLLYAALGWDLAYGSLQTKGVFLSDLDGDADLDALIARVWGAQAWWNDGQGRFTRADLRFAYDQDSGVAVGDFDGDGDPDVFAAGNSYRYRVWLNDGKGGLK